MSYWQRGCDDAKAGKHAVAPISGTPSLDWTVADFRANEGYRNGYDYGYTQYRMQGVGQRILQHAANRPT